MSESELRVASLALASLALAEVKISHRSEDVRYQAEPPFRPSALLPFSSQPTSSMRSVHAFRHTRGMTRMNWAMSGGSNRLVLVPSLSTFPTNTYTGERAESAVGLDNGGEVEPLLLTWSRVSPSVRNTVNVLPSRLDATLKALMNSALPMRLAPCVTIPVKRIFLCTFTCCHGNRGDNR